MTDKPRIGEIVRYYDQEEHRCYDGVVMKFHNEMVELCIHDDEGIIVPLKDCDYI